MDRTLAAAATETAAGQPHERSWSSGNRKTIKVGDRVFLLRQGLEPRGIVAAGTVTVANYEDDHWDEAKGGKAWYIQARFERILDPAVDPPLSVATIASGPLANVYWATQSSGIQIPDDAAILLEAMWREHVEVKTENREDPDAGAFPEGRILYRLHRQRERNREVIEQAKADAKSKHGRLFCCVCKFDFAAVYGEVGEGFIEGHHTKPLADLVGEVETKVSEIALVCSNCHRMLHRKRPWLTTGKLASLLAKRSEAP